MPRHTFKNSAISVCIPMRQVADRVPSCIRDHKWPLSPSSYNGPHSHSRKLRVSLSVIRWIPRSSPLEDFQNRGSRNQSREARDESNVRSEIEAHRPKGQCRESSPAARAARLSPTLDPWRMDPRCAGRMPSGASVGCPNRSSIARSRRASQTVGPASTRASSRPASRS